MIYRHILHLICIALLIIGCTTCLAFTTTPIIKFTGPRFDPEVYYNLGLDQNVLLNSAGSNIPENADVFDIQIGSINPTQRTTFTKMVVTIGTIQGFSSSNCFWLSTQPSTGFPTWVSKIIRLPNDEPKPMNSWDVFPFPTNILHDFTNEIVSLRCHIPIDGKNYPNSDLYPNTTINIQYYFSTLPNPVQHFTLQITSDSTLAPIRPLPFSDSFEDDYADFDDAVEVTQDTTRSIFRFHFPKSRIPNRGDSMRFFVHTYTKLHWTGTCEFSSNYLGSTISFGVIPYSTDVGHYIEFQLKYLPRIPLTIDDLYSGYVDCVTIFTQRPTPSFTAPPKPPIEVEVVSIKLFRGCDYRMELSECNIDNDNEFSNVQPQFPSPKPNPILITKGSRFTIPFNNPQCKPWEHTVRDGCDYAYKHNFVVPPSGTTVKVFTMALDKKDVIRTFELGTTTLNWDNPLHEIHVHNDIRLISSIPQYYIIYNELGEGFTVGSIESVDLPIVTIADCAIASSTSNWFTVSTNPDICQSTNCNEDYGYCQCDEPTNFNPFFEINGNNMCISTTSCNELIQCQDGSNTTKRYGQCWCLCADSTNPWRDCREDTTPNNYQPIITLQQHPWGTLRRFANDGFLIHFGEYEALTVNFGTIDEFYKAGLDHVQYFRIDIPTLSKTKFDPICTFSIRYVDQWYDDFTPISLDFSVFPISMDKAFHTTTDAALNNKISASSTTLVLANPRYNMGKPSKYDYNAQYAYLCTLKSSPILTFEQISNLKATIVGIGKWYDKTWNNINVGVQQTMYQPNVLASQFQLDNKLRVQIDPNNIGIKFMFDMILSSPPTSFIGAEISITSDNGSLYYILKYSQCRLNQNDYPTIFSENDWWDYEMIDFFTTTLQSRGPLHMTCSYYIQGTGQTYIDSNQFLQKLINDRWEYEFVWSSFSTTMQLTSSTTKVSYNDPIIYGEKLIFSGTFDPIQYPTLSLESAFNVTSLFKIIMHYPSNSGLGSIDLGFGSAATSHSYDATNSDFIFVYISSKQLKYCSNCILTFTIEFIEQNRKDGLKTVPLQLLSHFNPIVYPYCAKHIKSNSFGSDTINDGCPNGSICSYETNQCELINENEPICNNNEIWSHEIEQCIPQCNTNEVYDIRVSLCVSNCNGDSQQYYNIDQLQCRSYCLDPTTQWWNGSSCLSPCREDKKILRSNTNKNNYTCVPKCSTGQYWNNNKRQCINHCLTSDDNTNNMLYWNPNTLSCISSPACTTNQHWNGTQCITCIENVQYFNGTECISYCSNPDTTWDGTNCIGECDPSDEWDYENEQCISRCTNPSQIWDIETTTCINRCTNTQQYWSIDDNQCIDYCTNPKQIWDIETETCINRCPDEQDWDNNNNQCINRCQNYENWVINQCLAKCQSYQDWVESNNSCIDRCEIDQIWNGTRCINRCQSNQNWNGTNCIQCQLDQDWINNNCVDKCNTQIQTWNGTTCQCNDINTILNGTDCINKCPETQLWMNTISKCIDKCIDGKVLNLDDYTCVDPTSQQCTEGDLTCDCGQGQEWNGTICVKTQTRVNNIFTLSLINIIFILSITLYGLM